MPNFSVPPLSVNANLSHQLAKINGLMQVAQQWSAEGPCQFNQVPTHYSQDRFNTNTVRGRSIHPHITPNMLPVPHNRMSRQFDELEQHSYGYHNRRFQHIHGQEPD